MSPHADIDTLWADRKRAAIERMHAEREAEKAARMLFGALRSSWYLAINREWYRYPDGSRLGLYYARRKTLRERIRDVRHAADHWLWRTQFRLQARCCALFAHIRR